MKPGYSLMKHFLQFKDFRAEEYAYLFDRSRIIKTRFKNYERYQPLADRTLAMIFEKASTRTRVSFEAGMYQMGGSVVHLTTGDSQLGRAEPVEDSARVISRMVDLVMIRTYEQSKLAAFAAHSRVPVINGLTNEYHPCQILADIFTFIEHRGDIRGKVVAWVGDGNNMANTWLQAAEILGFTVHLSTPSGYEVDPAVAGVNNRSCYKLFNHPLQACEGAHLVTTDVWTSMGYEAQNEERRKAFVDWCVDAAMMAVCALPAGGLLDEPIRNPRVAALVDEFGMHGIQVNFRFAHSRADVARDVQVEIVLRDLFHRHPPGIPGFFLSELVRLDDLGDVLVGQLVLPLALDEVLCRVDEQHVIRLLALLRHQDAHRNAGGIEQVGRQADHRVDVPVLQQLGADALFRPAPEQHPVRQDDGHHPFVLQEVKAVQQEGKVGR